ncbi:putative type II DNA methylase protein [Cryptobacterium sp. CAG:338]|nr:putative type II DNA methylase protein [Cryptobacterium sp. CAG:338]
MINTNISIIYIDDKMDLFLSQYLSEEFENKAIPYPYTCSNFEGELHIRTKYNEHIYNPEDSYSVLFSNQEIKSADVILADHRLYTDNHNNSHKFSGSQFYVMSKLLLPQTEVLVITQETSRDGELIIRKYEARNASIEQAKKYYNEELHPKLLSAIYKVIENRVIGSEINNNNEVEEVFNQRIQQMLSGDTTYSELSASDVNSLVQTFQDIKKILYHE